MTRGYTYINILGAGYRAHNVQIFRTGSMNCAIPVEGFICTINSLLMNNLVCSQLFLQTLFSPLSQTLFYPFQSADTPLSTVADTFESEN